MNLIFKNNEINNKIPLIIRKYNYIFLILIINIFNSSYLYSIENWKIFGYLNTARQLHSAVAISDSEVLVIGGYNNDKLGNNLATC